MKGKTVISDTITNIQATLVVRHTSHACGTIQLPTYKPRVWYDTITNIQATRVVRYNYQHTSHACGTIKLPTYKPRLWYDTITNIQAALLVIPFYRDFRKACAVSNKEHFYEFARIRRPICISACRKVSEGSCRLKWFNTRIWELSVLICSNRLL